MSRKQNKPVQHKGSTRVHRTAEEDVREALRACRQLRLKSLSVPGKEHEFQVDGVGEDQDGNEFFVEIYCRVSTERASRLNSGHKNKIAKDLLKLSCCRTKASDRLLFAYVDESVGQIFKKNGAWYAAALKYHRIEHKLVNISHRTLDMLRAETENNRSGNRKRPR